MVGSYATDFFRQRLVDELNMRITDDVLYHASKLDVAHFEDPRFQDIMSRTQDNMANRFAQFIDKVLGFVSFVIQMVTLTGVLVVIEPTIVLVLGLVSLPYIFFQWRLAKSRYEMEFDRVTKRRWTQYFVTRLTSHQWVPETKLLKLEPLLMQKFRELMAEFRDQNQVIYRRIFLGSALFASISSIAFYLTFVRVAQRVMGGGLTIGDVAVYGGAMARLRTSLEQSVINLTGALEQTLHIGHLQEFLAIQPQINQGKGEPLTSSQGEIVVENVTFAYPGTTKAVLHDVSFHIQPGETVAVVGRNGAGKTTLVKLIARLYETDNGRVLLDGHDVRHISLDSLHQNVSFVFQQFGRYEATAAENIAYGNWTELLDDREAVVKIAKMADIHEMIEKMPQGYETILGRMFGEYTLSGGQWQKIALARAFARNASLLILDEPTANLDAQAEFQLFTQFRELAEGRTTILISHRFSTVSMADRILVMERGRIVESGSHDELLELNGQYAKLYDLHQRQMAFSVDNRDDGMVI